MKITTSILILFSSTCISASVHSAEIVFLNKQGWKKNELCTSAQYNIPLDNSCQFKFNEYAEIKLYPERKDSSLACRSYAIFNPYTNDITKIHLVFDGNQFIYLIDLFTKRYGKPASNNLDRPHLPTVSWDQPSYKQKTSSILDFDLQPKISLTKIQTHSNPYLPTTNVVEECIELEIITAPMADAAFDFFTRTKADAASRKERASKGL